MHKIRSRHYQVCILATLFYSLLLKILRHIALRLLFVHSQLLFDTTYEASTNPDKSTVQEWLSILQDFLQCGISFVFSQRLASVVVNRANYIRRTIRSIRGTYGRQKFLQQTWEMKVLESEICQRVMQERTSKKRKCPDKAYSIRHERRIKKQRAENCSNALSSVLNTDRCGWKPVGTMQEHAWLGPHFEPCSKHPYCYPCFTHYSYIYMREKLY